MKTQLPDMDGPASPDERLADLRSRLRDPIPWRTDKKRFGELTASEQNEILFWFLEMIWDELQDVRAEVRRIDPCA